MFDWVLNTLLQNIAQKVKKANELLLRKIENTQVDRYYRPHISL